MGRVSVFFNAISITVGGLGWIPARASYFALPEDGENPSSYLESESLHGMKRGAAKLQWGRARSDLFYV